MKTILKWIAYVSIATGIIWMASNYLAKDSNPQRSAKQPNGQFDKVESDSTQEPTPPRRYDLRKDRTKDEAPFTGRDVLWERKDNSTTSQVVLEISYMGSRQTLCWLKKYDQPETGRLRKEALALDKTGWAPGNWTTILPNGNPLHGRLLIKELPGGEFRIKKFDPDRRDSTNWIHDYSGTITPDWTAG